MPHLIKLPQMGVSSEAFSDGGLPHYTPTRDLHVKQEWASPHPKTTLLQASPTSPHAHQIPHSLLSTRVLPAHPSFTAALKEHHAQQQRRAAQITASSYPNMVHAVHPGLPHALYAAVTQLKDPPNSVQHAPSRTAHTWSGGGMVGRLASRSPHHQSHHPHLTQLPPYTTGNQGGLMPSEMPLRYAGLPQTMSHTPSAVSKNLDWQPQNHEEGVFHKKAISEWDNNDVVDFLFAAREPIKVESNDFDFDFSRMSGVMGAQFLKLDETAFKHFSANHGEALYCYFQNYKSRRESQARQAEAKMYARTPLIPPRYTLVSDDPTHTSPLSSLREPQLTNMDTAAPYELHFKTIDSQGLAFDQGGMLGVAPNVGLPSAALKSLPPMVPQGSLAEQNGAVNTVQSPDCSTQEEVKPEIPKKRGPGRPRKPENERKKNKKKTGRLWEFIRNLLLDPSTCPSLVRWENPEEGMFRFIQAEKVAHRWGDRKKNNDMNYEKLSRAMRYYYKTQIFEAVLGRRLVYKFGKNAKNWRPSNPSDPNFQEYHQQYQAG